MATEPQARPRWPIPADFYRLAALSREERLAAIAQMHAASAKLRAHLAFDPIYVGA